MTLFTEIRKMYIPIERSIAHSFHHRYHKHLSWNGSKTFLFTLTNIINLFLRLHAVTTVTHQMMISVKLAILCCTYLRTT